MQIVKDEPIKFPTVVVFFLVFLPLITPEFWAFSLCQSHFSPDLQLFKRTSLSFVNPQPHFILHYTLVRVDGHNRDCPPGDQFFVSRPFLELNTTFRHVGARHVSPARSFQNTGSCAANSRFQPTVGQGTLNIHTPTLIRPQ